jgi:hypothetical protein
LQVPATRSGHDTEVTLSTVPDDFTAVRLDIPASHRQRSASIVMARADLRSALATLAAMPSGGEEPADVPEWMQEQAGA